MGAECGDEPSAARAPTASDPDRGQGALLEAERGNDGEGDGKHPPLAANLGAEVGATRAGPNVLAQDAPAQLSRACGGELLSDLRARDLAGTATFDQGRAGLEDERLHLLDLTLEDLGDLAVAEVANLREDQCGLLTLGKLVEVCEQLPELATPLDLLGKSRRGDLVHLLDRRVPAGPQHREAAVARDGVEPRLDLRRLLVGRQGSKRRCEGLLESVLGVFPGNEDAAAEGEEPKVVAVIEDLEGGPVTTLRLCRKTLVAEGREEATRPGQKPGAGEGLGFHEDPRRPQGM